jgi:hypothetical protein
MSLLKLALGAAAPLLLGKGLEYAGSAGAEYFGTDTWTGSFLSGVSGFGAKLSSPDNLMGAVTDFSGNVIGYNKFDMGDMPDVAKISPTSVTPGSMVAAGQASQIPLGYGNRVPNMLQNSSGARAMISRVQTIPIPRSTITGSGQTIRLSSAEMPKSKV